ncbi:hypothetical protein ASPFODRAFT_54872 [Aspergillus luchuensis CBS 106.47]|uniref:Uncharacterized protein n=1 Tax=Aspergillus luchuensis (strain CBS 106.47) TaxID=1137211 RepID=A0A1M3SYQ3_ASPLC|nr:hypothetical protein ASPFODRAFT_54872 [Aspergillus luchuensis CBS 106.47]
MPINRNPTPTTKIHEYYIYLKAQLRISLHNELNRSAHFPDSSSVHFKLRLYTSSEKGHVKTRLPHDPEPQMTLAAFCLRSRSPISRCGKHKRDLLTFHVKKGI